MALTLAGTAQQFTSLLMIVAGVLLILDGQLSMGALIAANMLAGRVLAPIAGIAAVITRATQTFSSLRAIDKLMSLERERPPTQVYLARQIRRGSVVFDNVQFKYPNTTTNALDSVSFAIKSGERVGIIGRTGSGKTTVGRLLTGLYEPEEGSILIEGVGAAPIRSGRFAPRNRFRPAGYGTVFRQAARQYCPWVPFGDRRANSRSRASCGRRTVRRDAPAWLRHADCRRRPAACPAGKSRRSGSRGR